MTTSSPGQELIIARNVEDEMRESYLRYSMSVIISRALPDVRDGLKPSQRRILFAMRQLSLSPGSKHRKCAKICGDTSGDYHPHGEGVIYPTLARLAQEWVMRYPLVDGQGNFGSVDGDPPAAMRYTEARLTHASMHLMEDLDKETVDMVSNYDETKKEPTVFPSKFPNLLCNGSSGIAVGMATNIPPHNLRELVEATKLLLDAPHSSIEDIMRLMPAPDFPTGGVICGYRGVKEAYHTGRGKITLRAVIQVEALDKQGDKQQLTVTELPYGVNKARLIETLADLVNSKQLTGISDLRDESDKRGMSIAIELKKGEIPDVVINQLYKFTDMQVTFGCNMLALDNGLPRTMNIKQMLSAWIDHRIEVIRRRIRFELDKALARAHILEGYLKAIDYLDEVVKIIRGSEDKEQAKVTLIERFGFTDRQVLAVLELRLYQLTGLERDKLTAEYQELLKKIEHYRAVLASEQMVKDIIKEELDTLKEKHHSKRLTQIVAAEGEFQMEDLIANDPVILTVSSDDYVKRMPVDTFREQRRGGQGVAGFDSKKEQDCLKDLYLVTLHDYVLLFTTLGRCYWLKAWQIPEASRRAKGRPLINLLEDLKEGERVAKVLPVKSFDEPGACIFLVTRCGVVKKTELTAFSNPRRKGVFAITIDEGDEVIAARLTRPKEHVMLFTRQGMAVRFEEDQVRAMGRVARGVKGISLREGDQVVGCEVVKHDDTVLVVCERGYGKRSAVEEFRQTRRGSIGVRSIVTNERNGQVLGALVASDTDSLLMMSSQGIAVRINMGSVRVMGRNTQGVRLVNLKDKDLLVAMQKITKGAEVDQDLPPEEAVAIEESAALEEELEPAEEEMASVMEQEESDKE